MRKDMFIFANMMFQEVHNSAELMDLIDRIGFLPLLDSGIRGFSAEDIVDEDCRYVVNDCNQSA